MTRARRNPSAQQPVEPVLQRLRELARPERLDGMRRYGIATEHALGVPVSELRLVAEGLGRDHALAARLWGTGLHEARILAGIVDDPAEVDRGQMDDWVVQVDSWDLCDQLCQNLFRHTSDAYAAARDWQSRTETFVRRAGFALVAGLAVADRHAPDDRFEPFLSAIAVGADDERPHVRKAVSWALRQIGKRNARLHEQAVQTATQLRERPVRGARSVGSEALRDLRRPQVVGRLSPWSATTR